ncbi:MAG: hypothetical protein ACI9HK_006306, partial [Pirellulaceae bacterium]
MNAEQRNSIILTFALVTCISLTPASIYAQNPFDLPPANGGVGNNGAGNNGVGNNGVGNNGVGNGDPEEDAAEPKLDFPVDLEKERDPVVLAI